LIVAPKPVLAAEAVGEYTLRIQAPAGSGHGSEKLAVRIATRDDPQLMRIVKTRFILPY
jgi:hypothetical protein